MLQKYQWKISVNCYKPENCLSFINMENYPFFKKKLWIWINLGPCTCCIWKLRVLTSLRVMLLRLGRAGRRGERRGAGVFRRERASDPRRRAARARISVLRLWSDCRGARCPTVSRCLWIPILNARAGKTRRHALLRDGEEERIEAVKGVKIVFCFVCFFLIFHFSPPPLSCFCPYSLFQLQPKEELPWTWSTEHQLKIKPLSHSAPAIAALLTVSASPHCFGIYA